VTEDVLTVVAIVGDLMDRSRIAAAIPEVQFTDDPRVTEHADVVIVDLVAYGDRLGAVRVDAPNAHVVAYGPHVDEAMLERGLQQGADVVLPRSRFFRDPRGALHSEH